MTADALPMNEGYWFTPMAFTEFIFISFTTDMGIFLPMISSLH
jgi:hypothetical protein